MKVEKAIGYAVLAIGIVMFCSAQKLPNTALPPAPCVPNTDTMCMTATPTPPEDTTLHQRGGTEVCPATPFPTSPAPTVAPIQLHFQPSSPDTTQLGWRIFQPTGTPGPWPAVLVIHGGGFYTGAPYPIPGIEGDEIIAVATALQAQNYYVAVVDYRLARPGTIPGQPCHASNPASGRAPSQELDIEAEVGAMRHNIHCNGKVGVIGGSAGGTHAVWASLDTTVRVAWPFWNWNTTTMTVEDDRADAAVGLSGAYDFADRTPEDYTLKNGGDPVLTFQSLVENYTDTVHYADQHNLSPVGLLDLPSFDHTKLKPLYLINTSNDPMPFHQIIAMKCALESHGVSDSQFQVLTVTDPDFCHAHAFAFWSVVSGSVIDFFNANLK